MAVTPFQFGLPSGVHIETLREQAKELLKAVEANEPAALDRIKPYFRNPTELTLQRSQLVIAREHGFSSWRKLKDFSEARDELLDHRRQTRLADWPSDRKKFLARIAPVHLIVTRMAELVGIGTSNRDARRCGFCFKAQDEVTKFIAGSGCFICDECVETCTGLVDSVGGNSKDHGQTEDLHCDFCRKHVSEVKTVLAGSGTSICDECLELCVEIVSEGPPPEAG